MIGTLALATLSRLRATGQRWSTGSKDFRPTADPRTMRSPGNDSRRLDGRLRLQYRNSFRGAAFPSGHGRQSASIAVAASVRVRHTCEGHPRQPGMRFPWIQLPKRDIAPPPVDRMMGSYGRSMTNGFGGIEDRHPRSGGQSCDRRIHSFLISIMQDWLSALWPPLGLTITHRCVSVRWPPLVRRSARHRGRSVQARSAFGTSDFTGSVQPMGRPTGTFQRAQALTHGLFAKTFAYARPIVEDVRRRTRGSFFRSEVPAHDRDVGPLRHPEVSRCRSGDIQHRRLVRTPRSGRRSRRRFHRVAS